MLRKKEFPLEFWQWKYDADLELTKIDQVNGIIYLQFRSERSGKGRGRTYTVTISATDSSGNIATADVQVRAPHDKGK